MSFTRLRFPVPFPPLGGEKRVKIERDVDDESTNEKAELASQTANGSSVGNITQLMPISEHLTHFK